MWERFCSWRSRIVLRVISHCNESTDLGGRRIGGAQVALRYRYAVLLTLHFTRQYQSRRQAALAAASGVLKSLSSTVALPVVTATGNLNLDAGSVSDSLPLELALPLAMPMAAKSPEPEPELRSSAIPSRIITQAQSGTTGITRDTRL